MGYGILSTITLGILSVSLRYIVSLVFRLSILLSLQAEEPFDSTITLIIWQQYGHNLEVARFGGHPEYDGQGKVMSPDTLDAGVLDSDHPHLEKTRWEHQAVIIESQVACKRNPAPS